VKIEQDVEGMKEKMEEMKELMVQMFEKLRLLENSTQIPSAVNHASNVLMEDILVAGGWDSDGNALKSVARFSWKNNVWERVSSMTVGRKGATSFVHDNQFIFVAGGCDSDVIDVLNLNQGLLQWDESMAKVPYHCELRSVVYQNQVVLFCVCGKIDYCPELCLTAPYTCKQLCKMPEPARKHYTVVAFEHKVLIFGGSSGTDYNVLDSVLEFDLSTNEFKDMPPLPCAVSNMAGVRWGDQAVLTFDWRLRSGWPIKKSFDVQFHNGQHH
jgi:hypothetical protein